MDASAEFREYLKEAGVLDALTKTFVKLYELEPRPDDAVPFFQKQLNEHFPTMEEYKELLVKLETNKTALEAFKPKTESQNLQASAKQQDQDKLKEEEKKRLEEQKLKEEEKRKAEEKLKAQRKPQNQQNPNVCLNCYDFTDVDKHAANYPRADVNSLKELANNLCSPFTFNAEKARAIFTWLHHNIEYDIQSFLAKNVVAKTPEETLKEGLAVCGGYAGLFEELAKLASLDVKFIAGHGRGFGYVHGSTINDKENHAWNAVKLDSGNWQLIDSCWGAGYSEGDKFIKKFKPSEFTSSPEQFRRKHYPKLDDDQHCTDKISWDEYCAMEEPEIYGDFWDKMFSCETIEPCLKKIKPGRNEFVIKSRCEHTQIKPEEQYIIILNIFEPTKLDDEPLDTKIFAVDSNGTTWKCEAEVEVDKVVRAEFVSLLDDEDGKGKTIEEYKKRRKGQYKTLIEWHSDAQQSP